MEKIVFVGAGSMAEAIISGLVHKEVVPSQDIYIMNKADDKRLVDLQEKYDVSIVSRDKNELRNADLIVLATKPQDVHQAMLDIQALLNNQAAILSVIAGVTIDTIEQTLGKRPIARSMPNTSAAIGKSATGLAVNQAVEPQLKEQISTLLQAIGLVQEVEEDSLHTVTALSGSGPAYIYYLVEALEEAAVGNGLSKDVARALIVQTLEGATSMLQETKTEPSILRENVTSPNGTTFAGLEALRAGKFKDVIGNCITEASKRSVELAELTKTKS